MGDPDPHIRVDVIGEGPFMIHISGNEAHSDDDLAQEVRDEFGSGFLGPFDATTRGANERKNTVVKFLRRSYGDEKVS